MLKNWIQKLIACIRYNICYYLGYKKGYKDGYAKGLLDFSPPYEDCGEIDNSHFEKFYKDYSE